MSAPRETLRQPIHSSSTRHWSSCYIRERERGIERFSTCSCMAPDLSILTSRHVSSSPLSLHHCLISDSSRRGGLLSENSVISASRLTIPAHTSCSIWRAVTPNRAHQETAAYSKLLQAQHVHWSREKVGGGFVAWRDGASSQYSGNVAIAGRLEVEIVENWRL